MKKLNFNIKDRKILTLGLFLVAVCIFTLTIAYAALNAVLTIQGNAQVSSADWDIHLDNPRVTPGSRTINVPEIKTNSMLEFSTTLNMPGDFYEFTVDVVNDGSIDAMIENVVKRPELTVEQAKYLKYEISYQNGDSISTKQTLSKNSTMPIKVRIEYRNDLAASDLPTGQVVLDLSLILEYIQSDGTGSSVTNGGVDLYAVGTEKCFGSECFYIISSDDNNVTLLAKYNLNVGDVMHTANNTSSIEFPTGLQDINSKGIKYDANNREEFPFTGITVFSNDEKKGEKYSSYDGSIVEEYVNNYSTYLTSQGVKIIESRLVTKDEVYNLGCGNNNYPLCVKAPSWVYSSSYWTMSLHPHMNESYLYVVTSDGNMSGAHVSLNIFGVRPVIVISKDYF